MESSERSVSLWKATEPLREFPRLSGETQADVVVVGAGIAGITAAYTLCQAGKRVIVLDDNAVGGGETGQTTAHLSSALDDRYTEIEREHGVEGSRLAYQSHQTAIAKIAEIVQAEGIDCDFERLDGYLFLGGDDEPGLLEEELRAAHRAGFTAVELLPRAPLTTFNTGVCLRFPRQGQLHPLKYLNGVAEAVVRMGGRIHTGNHVSKVEGGPVTCVEGDGFRVSAGAVVVATNSPISDYVSIHTKQAPYRTYVIGARVPPGVIPRALYWDTPDPYHYVRLQRLADGGEMLVVGGEDHKTGHDDDADARFRRLEAWARERFPIESVELAWSGQVLEPADLMAFIGRDPSGAENVYIATGDSGHGMTHGTIAGMLIPDLILKIPNPWESLYSPGRITLSVPSAKEFVKENVDVAVQYTDRLRGGEVESEREVEPGTGAILSRGGKKIAAYRGGDGVLVERSAICTHLGCVVHWNSLERSWDCPCHGSRFTPTGEVLNGPALAPLPPVEE
jgi:glycine/D-amino acid oxidase-like deaminating enzyme/nitrite reductase/ring-hydroxylating ferredoxin subunit